MKHIPSMNDFIYEKKGFEIEVAVRDARRAQEAIRDAFSGGFRLNGSNAFLFDEEEDQLAALETLRIAKVEVLHATVTESKVEEHHGDEWPETMLKLSLAQFLDQLKKIDEQKYEKVESIIDSVIDSFA